MAHNYDYGLLISRLATANHRIYDQSVKNGAPDTVALSSAIGFYLKARRFWMSFGSGDDRARMNTAVAEANYLSLQHLQDKDADLAREYILDFSNIGKFAIFPADSVYRAVILQNESVYFFDKGDFASATNAKLECWRILAARRKTKN
jgi:hypothetical protein